MDKKVLPFTYDQVKASHGKCEPTLEVALRYGEGLQTVNPQGLELGAERFSLAGGRGTDRYTRNFSDRGTGETGGGMMLAGRKAARAGA